MYFYSVVVFTFIISSVSCANLSYNMLDVCLKHTSSPFVVPKNSLVSLHLMLNQHGLNCSVKFTSLSPQFNFHFDSLNLPFDNVSKTCLDSVNVSDSNTKETSLDIWCRRSDLPNSSFTKETPAVVTINNMCSPSKCNYNISNYKFDLSITSFGEIHRNTLSGLVTDLLVFCGVGIFFAICFSIYMIYKCLNRNETTELPDNRCICNIFKNGNNSDSGIIETNSSEIVTAQQNAPDAFDDSQLRQRNYGSFSAAAVAVAPIPEPVEDSNETQFDMEL